MFRPILAALALLCAAVSTHAENFTPEELARRTIERRAVEAVIWGMPMVNFDLMYQAMVRETQGSVNQIIYWSGLPDWKNQTLTPNRDAIYLMPFFSTKGRTAAGQLRAITFVINRKGGRYVAGLSLEEIADALAVAVGPWGSMAEYLCSTVRHLEELGLHDKQLWRLQELVAERIEAAAALDAGTSHVST